MIPVAEALAIVVGAARPLGAERVGLLDATGRVAATDVVSGRAVPAAANSAMDGYAVRSADAARPGARLRVVGSVPAGSPREEALAAGAAVKIFTGSVVPPGADAVVRVEDTEAAGDDVTVRIAVAAGANVRLAGEDVAVGATVLRAGEEIGPADVGVLASVGCPTAVVHRRPRVAIVSTGAELVELDETPGPGRVVNSNAWALAAAVREAGGRAARVLPIVRDRFEDVRLALEDAAGSADVVLSTGGVSVGDFDFVKDALDALGVERAFWKVAQKPGKPLVFGRRGGTLFFGLPGNPVSALVCFAVYVWPVLRRLSGHARIHLPATPAVLGAPVRRKPGLTEFLRVRLDDGSPPTATPARSQSSGVLSGLGGGAGLLVAPADRGALEAGERFDVLRLGPFAGAAASSVLLEARVASVADSC